MKNIVELIFLILNYFSEVLVWIQLYNCFSNQHWTCALKRVKTDHSTNAIVAAVIKYIVKI